MNVEVTRVSSKGQVVIPSKMRRKLGIVEGAKLMILSDGQNLLIKPISPPKMDTFKALIKKSRAIVKKKGLRKSDLKEAIRSVRNASRR